MNTYSNPAYPNHSFPQNWSSQDLVDAVPRRLFELVNFEDDREAANTTAAPSAHDWRRRGYLCGAELPAFIRVC
ncbi:MAG TPA: hypothetical protein VGQ93_14300 [Lysobacter sp.]|nr:hypothetical protein [Lysobacter sp.]